MQQGRFDIVLDFVCWLHQQQQSLWCKLVCDRFSTATAVIWEDGDSGGIVLHHESLIETQETEDVSLRHPEQALPMEHLPLCLPARFTADTQAWFVNESVKPCQSCLGTGYVGPNKGDYFRCPSCEDGSLYCYQKILYRWQPFVDHEVVLLDNTDRPETRQLIESRFAEGEGTRLETLVVDKLQDQVGSVNQRILDTALKAGELDQCLRERVASRGNVVRHEPLATYVPISYINIGLGRRYGQYFVTKGASGVQRIHPPLPICWARLSFWASVGLALLGCAAMVSPLASALPLAWVSLLPLLVTTPLAVRAYRDDKSSIDLWLICDDGDGTAWRHCMEQAKRWSKERRARIEDPYYLTLLEYPTMPRPTRQSFRFSFWVTEASEKCLELVYLSPEGLAAAGPELKALGRVADGLTWFSNKPAEVLDGEISVTLSRLGLAKRRHELRLVRDTVAPDETFPQLEALLHRTGSVLKLLSDATDACSPPVMTQTTPTC